MLHRACDTNSHIPPLLKAKKETNATNITSPPHRKKKKKEEEKRDGKVAGGGGGEENGGDVALLMSVLQGGSCWGKGPSPWFHGGGRRLGA